MSRLTFYIVRHNLELSLLRLGWSKPAISWAFYDWANSAFATIILAGIFPIFYREQWGMALSAEEVAVNVAVINSLAGLLLMLTAPLLGAIADASAIKKPLLLVCAVVGATMTALLAMIPNGAWMTASVFYVATVFLFMAGNVFYDSLLTDVAVPRHYDRISAGGYALGYLSGGLLLVVSIVLIFNADWFSSDQYQMMRTSFVITGVWWGIFTIPLWRYVQESKPPGTQNRGTSESINVGIQRLKETFRLLQDHPKAGWFLVAYWLYIDAVDTIIRMAVVYGQAIGFSTESLLLSLLIVQFVAFPATLLYGNLAQRFGTDKLIIVGILGYLVICIWGSRLETTFEFYALAVLIALFQGGLQAQSRAYFARLAPQKYVSQFFGFYNLLGRFAVVIGPALIALVNAISGDLRDGIASLSILLLLGLAVLYWKVLRVPTATK